MEGEKATPLESQIATLEEKWPALAADLSRVKLVHNVRSISIEGLESSASDSCPRVEVALVLTPTDPDINAALFPEGLQVTLSSGEQSGNPKGNSVVAGRLPRAVIENAQMPDLMRETLQELYTKAVEANPEGGAYRALARLDRGLNAVLQYFQQKEPTVYHDFCQNMHVSSEWTKDEQKRLEDALIWNKHEADPKIRWAKIAKYVGGGRTARECAERFCACRKAVESKTETQQLGNRPEGSAVAQADESKAEESQPEKTSEAAPHVRRHPIELSRLSMKGINLLQFFSGNFVCRCGRCSGRFDTHKVHRHCDGDRLAVSPLVAPIQSEQRCPHCGQRTALDVLPKLAFGGSHVIAEVAAETCAIVDVVRLHCLSECSSCSNVVQMGELSRGVSTEARCQQCHTLLMLHFEEILLAGVRQSAVPSAKKQLKKEIFKLGTPLPDEGACKHYKKSKRWLRFPCCSQAFPCDVCHDEATDHPCSWANKMICGYCSKEQPYAESCRACSSVTTNKFSSHWEGGKGCRDPTRMSRKDDKKYKLIARRQ